ncbi:MAG: biotin--[acetyl-CoA-carboxylase] ligase [Akkermansiaceae bacterium]|nr:biotin--[acetyl-CoA-carboxylase] ligase [Akkermansiaceae bacterium]
MFDLRQFAALAPDWYERLHYHSELNSTNDEARSLAEAGAKHGTLVLCDHQTAGRGRRGASWICEPGDGLLFSIVIRPTFAQANWSRIALAAGIGVVEALNDKWAIGAQVKWPNDIYIQNKKCAGILTEAREDFVVVGIGMNVMSAPTPAQGGARIDAVAVADMVSDTISREMVLATLLKSILNEVDACAMDFGFQLERLKKHCYLTGKRIKFNANEKNFRGLVCGVGSDGALLVEVDGVLKSFSQASEISLS